MKTGIYRHYKNKLYEVLGTVRNKSTLEELVLYTALYDHPEYGENARWVRPKNIFFENVIVDGKTIPRFEYLGDKKYADI